MSFLPEDGLKLIIRKLVEDLGSAETRMFKGHGAGHSYAYGSSKKSLGDPDPFGTFKPDEDEASQGKPVQISRVFGKQEDVD
jgi:hypothetical protein